MSVYSYFLGLQRYYFFHSQPTEKSDSDFFAEIALSR